MLDVSALYNGVLLLFSDSARKSGESWKKCESFDYKESLTRKTAKRMF